MAKPRRDWSLARGKVDAEGRCRVCARVAGDALSSGAIATLEAAHIIGRTHDFEAPIRWPSDVVYFSRSRVLVAPNRTVPLCGPVGDDSTCHGKEHAGRLELLEHLTVEEQAQAVADAGGLTLALKQLSPAFALRERERGRLSGLLDELEVALRRDPSPVAAQLLAALRPSSAVGLGGYDARSDDLEIPL
jgi:hypothetical protein